MRVARSRRRRPCRASPRRAGTWRPSPSGSSAAGTRWRRRGFARSRSNRGTSSRSVRSGSACARWGASTRQCRSSNAPGSRIRSRPSRTRSPGSATRRAVGSAKPCTTWTTPSRSRGAPTVVSEAWLLGALGEGDAAFDVLTRAEAEYEANLYFTGLPVFDSLRDDPRFPALLRRLEIPTDGRGA